MHDAAKRGDKELIIAIVIVLVVIFLIIAIMITFDNSISGNMELLKECLLNKMPVNQGDAAGESLFLSCVFVICFSLFDHLYPKCHGMHNCIDP